MSEPHPHPDRAERELETEREVEDQAAHEPDDPITHGEEVETELMEERTEAEETGQ
jgi:hypothetical protein